MIIKSSLMLVVLVSNIPPNTTFTMNSHKLQRFNFSALQNSVPNKNIMEYNTMDNNSIFSDNIEQVMYDLMIDEID